jgi:hypothetical protein
MQISLTALVHLETAGQKQLKLCGFSYNISLYPDDELFYCPSGIAMK